MKKILRWICALIVITALFSCNVTFSATQEELVEILGEVTTGGKFYVYADVDKNGDPLTATNIYMLGKAVKDYYNSETGYINIDSKDYMLEITDSKGNKLCEAGSFILDAEERYFLQAQELPDGEDTYTFTLIDVLDNSESATLSIKDDITSDKIIENKLSENTDKGWLLSTIKRLVSELFCAITLPCGDSYLHMISVAIDEPVTIDRIVYDDISKLSIDFFESAAQESGESGETLANATSKPMKDILSGTINRWYGIFRNFALLFYMCILVYFGIKILLTSTAKKKSIYKRILTAWVMGITMLIFFPYVMKYTIKLNHAFCKALQGIDTSPKMQSVKINLPLSQATSLYGNEGFVMLMLGKTTINETTKKEFVKTAVLNGDFNSNSMMYIRYIAQRDNNVVLAIVYFIMIGEILALLIMYYKRVFMLAFLITIFPIVVAFYPLSKTGDIKMNTFGVWFKEFVVNVFVQSFHAVTYVVIVSAGVTSYISNLSNGNWLFMIICILFLFEGEKIIRGIFNAKSSINSIGDIAASGMLAMNMVKKAADFMPKIPNRKQNGEGNAEKKATSDRPVHTHPGANTPSAQANANEVDAITNNTNIGNSNAVSGGVTSSDVTLGRTQGPTVSSANQSLENNLENAKSKHVWSNRIAGAVGGGASLFAQTVGTINGFAMGMAQNDGRGPSGLERGISSAIHGKEQGQAIGQGFSNIVTGAVGRVTAMKAGSELAKEYSAGDHDDEIFTEADKQMDDMKKQALREAYANAAKKRGAGFENSAEIKIIKERISQSKN